MGDRTHTDLPSRAVLVRYQREDGRVHAVNLQQAGLADGRTHTALLRLRGPARPSPALQLYVDCKLGDQHAGLPALAPIPPAEVDGLEIRTGQKAYLRMQVSREGGPPEFLRMQFPAVGGELGGSSHITLLLFPHPQGFVESMKMILGGSMARVGALSECPFQGDESIHSAGNAELTLWIPNHFRWSLLILISLTSPSTLFGSLIGGASDPLTPSLHLWLYDLQRIQPSEEAWLEKSPCSGGPASQGGWENRAIGEEQNSPALRAGVRTFTAWSW